MNKREEGRRQEETAASYLEKQGYQILERNFRCRMGEVDIIAREDNYLVFVEVKYRADSRKGTSLQAVDKRKQKVISKVAQFYLYQQKAVEVPCRFDVVGIDKEDIILIKNAFDYQW